MKKKMQEADVVSVRHGVATFWIIGASPLIHNSMGAKAMRELLLPAGRKTAAQKKNSLKHDPIKEFRASMYRRGEFENGPTRVVFPAPAFKGALMTAALDCPIGRKKSEVGRLSWIEGQSVDIYGVPRLQMSVVRSADMNRTPDVRTRAIMHEWATKVVVRFVEPVLTAETVATLLEFAGMTTGIGDFRQEKGKGNFGQFRLCAPDDPDWVRIVANGGVLVQDEAIAEPEAADAQTEDLLAFFEAEVTARGISHLVEAVA